MEAPQKRPYRRYLDGRGAVWGRRLLLLLLMSSY